MKKQTTSRETTTPNVADYRQANKTPMDEPETGLTKGAQTGKAQQKKAKPPKQVTKHIKQKRPAE